MAVSAHGSNPMTTPSIQRHKVLFVAGLIALQGLLLLVFRFEPRQPAPCQRPDCLRPVHEPRLNDSAGARPPPSAEWAAGTPPDWTRARPSSWPELVTALFNYIEKPHARCDRAARIGGQPNYKDRKFDGYKWVCLDPALGLLQTNSCLIYSFGVDHDWSFDDNVQRLQCEIHAFDPSIGRPDHRRSKHISFHNVGIGGKNEVRWVPVGALRRRQWDVRTYADIVRHLGHENRTVHYLKIDVEGSEWPMLAQMMTQTPQLLLNVRQLAVEVHMQSGSRGRPSLAAWKGYLETFLRLERMGFRLFSSEMNPYHKPSRLFADIDRQGARVYEMVWLHQPWK
ncbi:methyltransferase-like protein 24 [Amphibalanus amphitrite]|nr:methyltransferase-like protein 24 [Amphibalanus amphitrite]